jgi:hypothetical protein
MVKNVFEKLKLNQVFLIVNEKIQLRIHIFERVGFMHVYRLCNQDHPKSENINVVVMGVLRSEWYQAHSSERKI